MSPISSGVAATTIWVSFLAFSLAQACAHADDKTHSETATSGRCEYSIDMGGTMDGANTRSPVGYGAWTQKFEPNVSLRMENVGDTDVVNPWVFVNGKRHWRTVEEIVAEATAGRVTDKERAIGIWQFEIGHRFHWTTGDIENVDPVKVFNVYGYTLCGDDAQVISDLWRTAGFKVRRGFPQGHCTAEVFYDNKFHLLDGDESIICLLRDNETIGAEADVVRDHDLMKRTHTYGILSGDDRVTDEFSASLCVYEGHREGEHPPHVGHTMRFTLRPGEALEWRWDNVGKLHHAWQGYEVSKWVTDRVCNGRMSYVPRLPDPARQDGTVWKIESPYVIVGAKIKGRFLRPTGQAALKLSLSFDQKTWHEIFSAEAGETEKEVDLDKELSPPAPARYSYFVRLDAQGGAGVKGIAFESILQMAPLSLPALELGQNKVLYVSDTNGPQQVKITHTWRESSESRPPEAPPKPVFPEDGASVEGTQFVFRWTPPADPDGHKPADYHFQVSDRADMLWHLSPNFNRLISRTKDKGQAQFTIPYKGLLNPGRTYYWRIRAQDETGVWGPWGKVWSFTPQGPGVPVGVRFDRPDRAARTACLVWAPGAGRKPVKYRIYGSDEKGFTVSDQPYEILERVIQKQPNLQGKFSREMKPMPANFACETTETKCIVIGPGLTFPNANKAYYRVVAVDEKGIESGPSDYAAAQIPLICTVPPPAPRVGERWEYAVKATSSIGDLRCRTFAPEYVYNAGFWDKDVLHYHLHGAPAWLTMDEATGLLSGTPGEKDAGKYCFLVYADIPRVACDSQTIELEVKAR